MTGCETRCAFGLDTVPRSRQIFWFHQPDALGEGIDECWQDPDRRTLRDRIIAMRPLVADGLWPVQERAIRNVESSLAENRPRALIQVATGSGKTLTGVTPTAEEAERYVSSDDPLERDLGALMTELLQSGSREPDSSTDIFLLTAADHPETIKPRHRSATKPTGRGPRTSGTRDPIW